MSGAMADPSAHDVQVRNWPRTALDLLRELGHVYMSMFWAMRLMLRRTDTRPTYRYCWHLDRVTYFRSRYRAWLAADRSRLEAWMRPRLFVDHMPDEAAFASYPAGTVGREYYDMCRRHRDEGLLDLRRRRLEVNADEAAGLDLERLRGTGDSEELFRLVRARRNIFMTSTHDFCHMLLGCDTTVSGEALVARYQYNSLLVPQNWMNMVLAMLSHAVTFRLAELRRIMRRYPAIDAARDYWSVDFDAIWGEPVGELRARLGLPRDGIMAGAAETA